MTGFRRILLVAVFAAILVVAPALHRAPAAHAYGSTALWQIGMSFNCDNPSICGSQNLGGFWGWAEFDSGSTGDAQLTGCSHLQGSGPAAGAQHISVDVTGWTIKSGSAGPLTFFVTSEIDRITRSPSGPPVTMVIASENMDTGIPAVAGHYDSQTVFLLKAPPGTAFNIQVVQLNH